MADTQLKTRIILRNDTKGNWDLVKTTAILLKGEIGIEFDPSAGASTGYKTRMKVGDGINVWDNLPYFGGTEAKVYQVEVAAGADHKAAITTAVGSNEKNSGDIAIVKELINESATGIAEHRQYTAYVYDSTLETPDWVAMDGNYNAENVYFAQDVKAFTNVGMITGASQTSPKTVVVAGKTVKDAFTAIFGEQQDTEPTISQSVSASVTSSGITAEDGGEYGKAINAKSVDIKFSVSNSGTAGYGYRVGSTKTTGSKTFYYPIKTLQYEGQDYDIKVTATTKADISKLSIASGGGTIVATDTVNGIIYGRLNSSKQFNLKLAVPSGTSTTSAQTLVNTFVGAVSFNAANTSSTGDSTTAITKFLTFLGNDATTKDSYLTVGDKTATSTAYTITAGSYYPYYMASTSDNITTVAQSTATKSTNNAVTSTGVVPNPSTPSYIWFFLQGASGSKTINYEALGQWYGFGDGTAGPTDVTITLNSGATVTYKGYHTLSKGIPGGTKYRIN